MSQLASQPMRVAVLDDYQHIAESLVDWSSLNADIEFLHTHIAGVDELAERLSGFEVVVAMRERTPFLRPTLEALSDLRLLVTTGSANASIDVAAANELGIVVSGTSALSHPTAEMTMAMILALARGLVDEVRSLREGGWQVGVGRALEGSTLGIVGLGRLGSQVARLGQAFGMDVIAWSQNISVDGAAENGARVASKDELLTQADFVTIHLRLSARSRGLIGERELALMKPSAYLINTSRGAIVDEAALLAAVRSGVISGAGLDVYEQEPLPSDHPFRSEPRILATPHIGYVTQQSYEVFFQGAVESIKAWEEGNPIRLLR